jgi:uncharacterized protein YndB with AHSA1/START domain
MKATTNTIELTFERTIPASPAQVFEGWLSAKVSGTPWNIAEKLSLDPKIDGLFYFHVKGVSHYGRFTEWRDRLEFGTHGCLRTPWVWNR